MDDDDEWDDDCDPDLDECDHENATVDILTGELSCSCGYRRWLSGDEIRKEAQLQAEMMEAYYQECEDADRSTTDLSPGDRRDILLMELTAFAFRMQCRVDYCIERDGPEGAVTGLGIGISFLLARDLVRVLTQAHEALEPLPAVRRAVLAALGAGLCPEDAGVLGSWLRTNGGTSGE